MFVIKAIFLMKKMPTFSSNYPISHEPKAFCQFGGFVEGLINILLTFIAQIAPVFSDMCSKTKLV